MITDITDRQLDLLNVLWDEGPSTVRETKKEIEDDLAYTSVLTVFQTLEKNGYVDHERSEQSRAYLYYPTVEREQFGREAVKYVFHRFFDASMPRFLDAVAEQDKLDGNVVESLRQIRTSTE